MPVENIARPDSAEGAEPGLEQTAQTTSSPGVPSTGTAQTTNILRPDQAEGMEIGFDQPLVSAAVQILLHPEVVLELGADRFVPGSNGPLRFEAKRKDNKLLSFPTQIEMYVTTPLGAVDRLTGDRELSEDSLIQAVALLYPFTIPGIYRVRCLVTFGDVIAGTEVLVYCQGVILSY